MLLDIAIGIVLVVALPGADLLPQQLVVLVILAAEGDAVAPGQALQRAEGQVGDLPDQGARRLVAYCQGHAGDLAAGVAQVADGEAGGVADLQQLVGRVVAVGHAVEQGLLVEADAAYLLDQVAALVVAVHQAVAGTFDGAQAADALVAVGGEVVAVLYVEARVARRVALDQAIEGVVAILGDRTASVGAADDVAGGVVLEGGGAAVRADQSGQVAEAVVFVAGGDAARVLDLGEVVLGVVGELGLAAERIALADQPVEGVEGLAVGELARVGFADRIVVEVVGEAACLAAGADRTEQPAKLVVGPLLLTHHAAAGVLDALGGAIALGVDVVFEAFAEVVADRHQPPCVVVFVAQPTAVAAGDAGDLADRVIVEAGGAASGADGGQPAVDAGVGEAAGDAVGIGDAAGLAALVIVAEAGDLAEGVGHLGQVAATVVGIEGDVLHIGARTVGALDQAESAVAVAPGALGRLRGQGEGAGQAEGAKAGEVWGDAHGGRPCQRVVTVSPVLRPSASYW
ncbi:hypothetical protein PA40_05762 [Pseudomonas aeruginosa]|nr:hypothetical protein PA40_05762 [Pseudomonas aeruginosa]